MHLDLNSICPLTTLAHFHQQAIGFINVSECKLFYMNVFAPHNMYFGKNPPLRLHKSTADNLLQLRKITQNHILSQVLKLNSVQYKMARIKKKKKII